MTSPDERFDDAYRDNGISRGLWQVVKTEPMELEPSHFTPITHIVAVMNYIQRTYNPRSRSRWAHCDVSPCNAPPPLYAYRHICWPAIYDWLQDIDDPAELYILTLKLHQLQW